MNLSCSALRLSSVPHDFRRIERGLEGVDMYFHNCEFQLRDSRPQSHDRATVACHVNAGVGCFLSFVPKSGYDSVASVDRGKVTRDLCPNKEMIAISHTRKWWQSRNSAFGRHLVMQRLSATERLRLINYMDPRKVCPTSSAQDKLILLPFLCR
jgi:hypothetical protein